MPDANFARGSVYRWLQLLICIVCMVMVANLQYGWTLFVLPIDQKHHWGPAAIQIAFTILVLAETWPAPIEGWFVDRFGPNIMVLIGGVLVAVSWTLNSVADSLILLYVAAAIGGYRGGSGLWYVRRAGAEMVPRPARARRRPRRGGFRGRIGADDHSDPKDDHRQRL